LEAHLSAQKAHEAKEATERKKTVIEEAERIFL
jgi:hypothetical protein